MPQLIGAILVIGFAIFVLWTILALFVRVISFALLYWGATLLLGGLVGLCAGVVLPARVLVGKGRAPFRQITPADLVAGKVIDRKPAGPNREYGWDSAWPNYIPYQAIPDAQAVAAETSLHLQTAWAQSGAHQDAAKVVWFVVGLSPLIGYTLGVWVSVGGWYLVMGALGLVVVAVQQVVLGALRLTDVLSRRRRRATLKCPSCYGESALPGYRCTGPGCSVVHWSMLPGALGLFTRRCSCGAQLPNTVTSAAAKLVPVCPYCRQDLVEGSGARQTIQLALIGGIGAGKTRLLDAATVAFDEVLRTIGGELSPLDGHATTFLKQSHDRIDQQSQTPKTQHQKPAGLPFLVRHDGVVVELQVIDAAGEAFANWEETAKLRYLDRANAMIFVLDPLALPRVNDQFRRSRFANSVLLATGDQEDAYGAAVDRMRAEKIPVGRRQLAVVLTKGDILTQLPLASTLVGRDSDSIRSWLVNNGSDLLVRRFEKDFKAIRYFIVDSMSHRKVGDPLNPWWTIEWLLRESGTSLKLAEAVSGPKAVSS